ncbi:cactin [Exaiptasia diaphana]|uniref:Uncharacterized protein n=1 Tax=Exaiptasia diaphana TaxID=2652724 RepID=A0A913YRA6_EXADI|nr:cactin [Exaiptasia diaphana]
MSGRSQGRGRQSRRERSQRSRGRDNSADSVSSVRSERERDPNRNGRTTRRRPERRDERPRKTDEKPSERESSRNANTDKRDDKVVDRHSNTGNDSRLVNVFKRINRETDRERRIAAAKQLEEYFCCVENVQIILKNADTVLASLEDILYERGLSDIKEPVTQCLVLFGNLLSYDSRR